MVIWDLTNIERLLMVVDLSEEEMFVAAEVQSQENVQFNELKLLTSDPLQGLLSCRWDKNPPGCPSLLTMLKGQRLFSHL